MDRHSAGRGACGRRRHGVHGAQLCGRHRVGARGDAHLHAGRHTDPGGCAQRAACCRGAAAGRGRRHDGAQHACRRAGHFAAGRGRLPAPRGRAPRGRHQRRALGRDGDRPGEGAPDRAERPQAAGGLLHPRPLRGRGGLPGPPCGAGAETGRELWPPYRHGPPAGQLLGAGTGDLADTDGRRRRGHGAGTGQPPHRPANSRQGLHSQPAGPHLPRARRHRGGRPARHTARHGGQGACTAGHARSTAP